MDSQAPALAERVRDLVRERRIDPRTDADSVRRAALDVIAEHESRSLTGAVRSLDEPDLVVGQIVADVSGFGPLQAYLDDETVEEIWINEPSRVFVARAGRHELTPVILTAEQVRELVERMLSSSGRRLDISQPFVDAMLPGGHRLHVVLDGISRGFAAVNIRKFVAKAHSLDDLVTLGTLDPAGGGVPRRQRAGRAQHRRVRRHPGGQDHPAQLPGRIDPRIAATGLGRGGLRAPVRPPRLGRDADAAGRARGHRQRSTCATLVKEALRMRPSRIIVGEVRAAECLDLLLALNAGLPGMASIHANSAKQALVKMCTLPLLAGDNIGSRFVVPTVASSVDLVVHTGIDPDGSRAVREIATVTGRVENGLIESEPVFVRRAGRLERGHGAPLRRDAFELVGIDLDDVLGVGRWVP